MREDLVDLWSFDVDACDARCITINGTIRHNGRGVMGRGTAKQAKERILGLELILGSYLHLQGLHVGILHIDKLRGPIVAFPVKHEWHEKADIDLIIRSCQELSALATERSWTRVILPRPGCGNGGRSWEHEVRPRIWDKLDNRFQVVTV